MRIGLFIPCYIDAFFPEVGIATLELELVGPRREFNLILAVKYGFRGLVNCMPGWDPRDEIRAKLARRRAAN
jgi:hypothetical protein